MVQAPMLCPASTRILKRVGSRLWLPSITDAFADDGFAVREDNCTISAHRL